jgi:hypothetical protein
MKYKLVITDMDKIIKGNSCSLCALYEDIFSDGSKACTRIQKGISDDCWGYKNREQWLKHFIKEELSSKIKTI